MPRVVRGAAAARARKAAFASGWHGNTILSAVKKAVDKRLLKGLVPINALAPQHFNEIADKIIIEDLPAGRVIFKEGERDNRTVYLLAGEITLFSGVAPVGSVYGDTEFARHPLSSPQPRQVTAKAKTPVTIARIDTGLLDVLLSWDQSSGYEVTELEDGDEDWMSRMLQSPTFQKLPAANIQKLLMSIEEYPAVKGGVVIRQGDPGDYYYIIKQGRCVVTRKASPAAQDVQLAELSVGDSFGEDALISDSKRNATITMLTDGRLMRLAKKDFVALLREPLLAQVSFAKAQSLVNDGAQWLDVRLPGEFQQDHIGGAVNIPLAALRHRLDDLDIASRYIVYCDNGGRSSTAAFLLGQHSYDVRVLTGGMQALAPSEMRAVQTQDKSVAAGDAAAGNASAEVIDFSQQAQARKTTDESAAAPKEARHAAEQLLAEARRRSEQLLHEAEQRAAAGRSMLVAERDAALQKIADLELAHQQLAAQYAQLQQALQIEIERAKQLAATPAVDPAALAELRRELKAAQRNAQVAEQARQALAQELSTTLANLQQTDHAAQEQLAAEFSEELDALRDQLRSAQRDVVQAQQAAQAQLAARDEKIAALQANARQQELAADRQRIDLDAAHAAANRRAAESQAERAQAQQLQTRLDAAEQRLAEQQSIAQQLQQELASRQRAQAQALAEASQAQQTQHDSLQRQLAELQEQRAVAGAAEQRAQALASELLQLQAQQALSVEQQQRRDAEQQAALTELRATLEANEQASSVQLEALRAELARAGDDLQRAQALQTEQVTALRDQAAEELAGWRAALADQEHELARQTAQWQAELEQARQDGAAGSADLEARLVESRQAQHAERDASAAQLAQLREALAVKTQLAEAAQVATAELQAQLTEAQQRTQAETAQLTATATTLRDALEATQAATQTRQAQLEARIKSLQDEADAALAHTSQQAEDRITALQTQLTQAQQHAARAAEQQTDLQHALQAAQSRQEELQVHIKSLQDEADAALSKTSAQAEARITELQALLAKAERDGQAEAEQQHQAAAALQQEVRNTRAAREELQVRIETLRKESDAVLGQTSAQADARIAELQAQLAAAELHARSEAELQRGTVTTLQQDLQAAQTAHEALQSRIKSLQDEADAALSSASAQADARSAELQAQLAAAERHARSEVEQLRGASAARHHELQIAQRQCEELQSRIQTLQDDAAAALARTSEQADAHLASELAKLRAESAATEQAAQREIVSLREALRQETLARAQDSARLTDECTTWQVLGQSLEDQFTQAERERAAVEAVAKTLEQELERLRGESSAAHQAAGADAARAQQEIETSRAELRQLGERLAQSLDASAALEAARGQAESEIARLKARVEELASAAQSEDARGGKSEKKHAAALNKLRAELTAAETEANFRQQELQARLEQALEQGRATEARFAQQQARTKESDAQLDQARRRAAQLVQDVEDVKRELEAQTHQRLAVETARKAAQQQVDALRAESQIMSNLGDDHIEASAAQRVREQQAQIARLESELQETKKNVEVAVRLRAESDSARQAFEQEVTRLKDSLHATDAAASRRAAHGGTGFTLRGGLGLGLAAGWLVALGLGAYLALSDGKTSVSSAGMPAAVIASTQSVPAPAHSAAPKPKVKSTAAAKSKAVVHALGTFSDALRDGGSGPLMTRLPAGGFQMGSAANSLNFDETPRHEVKLKAFAIGSYEVSFADYDRFATATGRSLPDDHGWGRGNQPAINVSWDDAAAYARWLSEQTGHRYALPSEAEWEYAAAAGTSTFYFWGNSGGENHAVCFNCGSRWDNRQTAPVGSFAANAFGLYDTAGNVLEWVADCRHEGYQGAPADGSVWAGGDCTRHMARGGAYDSPVDNLRIQSRPYFATGVRLNNLGLRVVRRD